MSEQKPQLPEALAQFDHIELRVTSAGAHRFYGIDEAGKHTPVAQDALLEAYGYSTAEAKVARNGEEQVITKEVTVSPTERLQAAEEAFKAKRHTTTYAEVVRARKAVAEESAAADKNAAQENAKTKLAAGKWEARMALHMAGRGVMDKMSADVDYNPTQDDINTLIAFDQEKQFEAKQGLPELTEDDERYYRLMQSSQPVEDTPEVVPSIPIVEETPEQVSNPDTVDPENLETLTNQQISTMYKKLMRETVAIETEESADNMLHFVRNAAMLDRLLTDLVSRLRKTGESDSSIEHLYDRHYKQLGIDQEGLSTDKEIFQAVAVNGKTVEANAVPQTQARTEKDQRDLRDKIARRAEEAGVSNEKIQDPYEPTDNSDVTRVQDTVERTPRRLRLRDRWTALRVGDLRTAFGSHKESKEGRILTSDRLVGATALAAASIGLYLLGRKTGVDISPFDGDNLDLNPFNNDLDITFRR